MHDFTATAAKDPKVNFSRNGKYKLDGKTIGEFEEFGEISTVSAPQKLASSETAREM